MSDRLYCRCGGEVRLVRLTPRYLTLGHVRNPKLNHHVVRLAPAARTGAVPAAPTGQPEGSEPQGLASGPSPDRRSPRAGRVVPGASMTVTSSPARRRVVAGLPPAPAPRFRGALDRS